MSQSVNTKTSLDTMFKYAVADKVNELVPDNVTLLKLIPKIAEAEKIGRKYLVPVALTLENGVTFGDDTAFTLNNAIAGVYGEIQVNSNPVVLRSQVSQAAANRMANEKKAFITWATLRAENMYKSLAKTAEVEMWYGLSATGIGAIDTSGNDYTSGTTCHLTISDATFAPGIWGGREGSLLEVRNGPTLVNTNADVVVTVIDVANRKLTVTGNATDLAAISAGHALFFKGAYANGMAGIDKQLTNTGSLFNIDASQYALWQANSYAAGSASMTLSKALKAVSLAVGKGGLDSDVNCFVSSQTYENMNSDLAALRMLDSSYSKAKGENGVESLVYHCQAGLIKIVPTAFVKHGEAFIVPEGGIKRVGASDLTFGTGHGSDEFFLPMAGQAGYELRCQYDFAVLIDKPAQCVKVTGIVNS